MIDLLIVVVMIAIIVSLGFGLYYLVNDRGTTNRIVMSLSYRVALAILLLALLAFGFWTR